jgi:copper chaperone CopZ
MNVQGVQTADASLAKGVVEVSFNDEVANIDALLAATKNAGYPSYLLEQH